jgi:hypothetical protein
MVQDNMIQIEHPKLFGAAKHGTYDLMMMLCDTHHNIMREGGL